MNHLSNELQIGKAAEHIVAADLILQGYSAWLTDAGLPYDVVVDINGVIKRIQVKATTKLIEVNSQGPIYRFGTRKAGGSRLATIDTFDFYAFVALDIKTIAYFDRNLMLSRSGQVKQTVDLKSKFVDYKGRVYPNGTIRTPEWGRYIQDYTKLPI